ncbi:protocadherin Fat 4 [Oncorhynchus nerka]|uniref:protocadherin Fat 4 n=1 Tax=Oncorhynchus nerka TaxID=8023 RepID=UPI0031B86774
MVKIVSLITKMDTAGSLIKWKTFLFYLMVVNFMFLYGVPFSNMADASQAASNQEKWSNMTLVQRHPLSSWYQRSHWHGNSKPGATHSPQRRLTPLSFSKLVYSFQVKEDTQPGTIVGNVEAGEPSKGSTNTIFSVLEDDGEGLFLLSRLSGDFLLSRSLDYETQRLYILTVVVKHGDLGASRVRVYFNVLDVNDNLPVFRLDSYSVSVPEDSPVGTCFLDLNVSDADDGMNGEVDIEVTGEDGDTTFSVNPDGALCLNIELDRESSSDYRLTVQASDRALSISRRLTATTRIVVNVDDINDNMPSFTSAGSVTIPEDTALQAVVMVIQAVDVDSGSNGDIVYTLEDTSVSVFSINSTNGRLYLQQPLDREQLDTLTVTVTATDRGSPPLASSMNLAVHVEDVNDHNPEFTHNYYSLAVREDTPRGTSLLQLRALDGDIGYNGQVRYQLSQGSPFLVDSVRGVISLIDRLDRERDSFHLLAVTAMDQGSMPRSATAVVNITVLDVNDCSPLFSPDTLTLHVLENGGDPSQLTHQVSARDDDLGVNSQMRYFIDRDWEGLFSLSPNGTFHILQSLDREVTSLYKLDIMAVDSGLPPLTGTVTVHVVVDDMNDNRPVFSEEVYTTIVYEDSPAGTVFAMVTAYDADEGVNGQIRYSIESADGPFSIEDTSGELLTTGVLDREAVAIYRLTVVARDTHPTQQLSSSVQVSVLVADVNDHWPQFLHSPYVANMPAGSAPGSVVCAVRAVDGDSGINAQLHFFLYGQNTGQFFISPHRGTIFTTGALAGTNDFTINVHVEDGGDHPKFDTTTVTIRFQNASEFPTVGVDVLRPSLSEEDPEGTLVALVSAGTSRAGPVSFYLVSGDSDHLFRLHQATGQLTIHHPLDYETNKEFLLLVEARDAGSPPFSSYAEIHVNVTDVNDNAPQFTQREYRCEVLENSPATWVCDVLAIDADSGSYGKVQYSILEWNNIDHVFTIDSENGMLSTTTSLDREEIPEYNLTIVAADKNNSFYKDIAVMLVVVVDTNDHAPRFTQIFFTEVTEDSPIGHTILQIVSTDDDIGANAVMTYSIIDQRDDVLPFSIDKTSGCITVLLSLDRETQDHYVMKVNANDSAWTISTDVTIDVTDVNDNKPVFTKQVYTTTVTETRAQEVFVMRVLAMDADLGQNSQIVYLIDPPSEHFWVNASTGDILTKQPISLLHQSASLSFSITVVASDCGNVRSYSNSMVIVTVVQYNHFPPSFLPFPTLLSIPFNITMGTEVVRLTAVDRDSNRSKSNTTIEYSLAGGNASDFFVINMDDGRLMLNRTLRQSINSLLMLIVTAKDQGFPPLSSQAVVQFEVTGENQFSPQFSEMYVTFSVPEDLLVGSVIGKVQAEDGDDGVNGVLSYSITSGNKYSPFSLGQRSGLITLVERLDYEKQGVYRIQITAKDGGWISKTGTVIMTVNVSDVNDNPPVFTLSQYTASVLENSAVGTPVLQVGATDADSSANADITYSLMASGHSGQFAIDSRNGTVTTLDIFDFELKRSFEITVKASDAENRHSFSIAHVNIQVSGVNEFSPAFLQHKFNLSVSENVSIGTRVGKVTATDSDEGLDGLVFYLLIGQSRWTGFDVDEQSGEIYITADLRKQGYSHVTLRILAKNRGVITGLDVDEALVHINIVDTNDPPEFSSGLYSAEIREDSLVGNSVIRVVALDQDSVPEWSRFSYSIPDGNVNSSFFVDPVSGLVSVSAPLDRELWPLYNLTVTATDQGSPPATGTAQIVVTITDVNDNAPTLVNIHGQVKENQPAGTIVARLNSSDADLPPNQGPFSYWIVQPASGRSFTLTSDGVLSTSRPLDREVNSVFHLSVVISDAGTPPLSSTTMFNVRVEDENDNPSVPRNVYIEVKYYGSAFPGGFIGDVRPEDQDVVDTFNCSIRNGPLNMFTIPDGTCDIWSSPYQGEATYNITIEATDHLHPPVNNSIYVNYKGFTNASMDSCILFYVASTSVEDFLSLNYLKFVKALDSLFNLQASKTHMFGIKLTGDKVLLLAAVKSYNGQYLNGEVASSISAAHQKLLEAQSNITLSYISSDPCLINPCLNGATCNKNVHIGPEVFVLESPSVIFVSPQNEIFNCLCSAGFAGTLCELDVDECDERPCEKQSVCVNNPGGFRCHCRRGFSGLYCSADLDVCLGVHCQHGGTCLNTEDGVHCDCSPGYEGDFCEHSVNHCASAPCFQGNCTNGLTGYTCHCPFGVSGIHCEEDSYGFEELSYMEFPPLDPRSNFISLELATLQQNSLLLYNPAGSGSVEYLALEVVKGRVRLSYDLGSGAVRLQTERQVADGRFHSITVRRIGNIGSLQVDHCPDVKATGFCLSQSNGIGSKRTLDVGGSNMTFGGVRSIESVLLRPGQVQTHDFVGCVRNMKVNGIPLGLTKALAAYNFLERCPRAAVSPCLSGPCLNGGVCQDLWSHYICQCTHHYTGTTCNTEISEEHVLRLGSSGYIEYVVRESYRREQQLRDLLDEDRGQTETSRGLSEIEVKVKTVERDAVLLFVLGRKGHFELRVMDGNLLYVSRDRRSDVLSEVASETSMADGDWHVLHLSTVGQSTVLLMDGQTVTNTSNNGALDLSAVNVEKIVLGATPPPPPRDTRIKRPVGFSGCVEYVRYNGHFLPVSGYSLIVEVWPSSTLLQSSCESPGSCVPSCSCVSTTCPEDVPTNARLPCLSLPCPTAPACGGSADTRNSSCICLTAGSCELCSSPPPEDFQGGAGVCSDKEALGGPSAPLWVIGVVLPITSFLLCLGLGVFLCLGRRNANACCHRPQKRQAESGSPQRGEEGTDNGAFCFEGPRTTSSVPAVRGKPPDGIRADKLREAVQDGYSTARPGVEAGGHSEELEYYEIDSVYSVFQSDTGSLRLTGSLHNTDWERTETGVRGGLRGCQKKTPDSPNPDDRERPVELWQRPLTHPDQRVSRHGGCGMASGPLSQVADEEQRFPGRLVVPGLRGPPHCLSVEEVRKLNSPVGVQLHQLAQWPRPGRPTRGMDSNTHSSFTCSEVDFDRDFALLSAQGLLQERTLITTPREPVESLPVPPSRAQYRTRTADSGDSPQHWEQLLNMCVCFHTYAPVFEDIAGLPMEQPPDWDRQSDLEEII